jgi:hypothetical protein
MLDDCFGGGFTIVRAGLGGREEVVDVDTSEGSLAGLGFSEVSLMGSARWASMEAGVEADTATATVGGAAGEFDLTIVSHSGASGFSGVSKTTLSALSEGSSEAGAVTVSPNPG